MSTVFRNTKIPYSHWFQSSLREVHDMGKQNVHTHRGRKKNKKHSCVMTLNSRSNVVLGIVIYTAGKFHIGNPSPLRILSPTLFPPPKKTLKYYTFKIPLVFFYVLSFINCFHKYLHRCRLTALCIEICGYISHVEPHMQTLCLSESISCW